MNQSLHPGSRTRTIALLVALAIIGSVLLGIANSWQSSLPRVAAHDDGAELTLELNGGGGKNLVQTKNQHDDNRRMRANIQLNRIPGPDVAPVNAAIAQASCIDCQTIAIALQINLIGTSARQVTPQNAAAAVNYGCTRCITIAVALQYVISVDDPTRVPPAVDNLIREMERELRAIAKDRDASVRDVVNRINVVLAKFRSLAASLSDRRDEATEPTSPEATPENFATPESGSPAATPVASPVGTEEATTVVSESGETSSGVQSTSDPTGDPTADPNSAAPTTTPTPVPTVVQEAGTPGT